MDLLDVAVVGGGQAGLAIARRLRRLGLRFLVLDASPEIGQAGSVSGSASHPKPALQNTSAVSNRPGTVISVRAKRSPTPVSIQARIIGSTGRSSRPTTSQPRGAPFLVAVGVQGQTGHTRTPAVNRSTCSGYGREPNRSTATRIEIPATALLLRVRQRTAGKARVTVSAVMTSDLRAHSIP
jgi:hypothetical protein